MNVYFTSFLHSVGLISFLKLFGIGQVAGRWHDKKLRKSNLTAARGSSNYKCHLLSPASVKGDANYAWKHCKHPVKVTNL